MLPTKKTLQKPHEATPWASAAAEMAEQEEAGEAPSDDGVVDADFEVVDEDED